MDCAINYLWVLIKKSITSYNQIKLISVFHKMAANLVKSFDLFCLYFSQACIKAYGKSKEIIVWILVPVVD